MSYECEKCGYVMRLAPLDARYVRVIHPRENGKDGKAHTYKIVRTR